MEGVIMTLISHANEQAEALRMSLHVSHCLIQSKIRSQGQVGLEGLWHMTGRQKSETWNPTNNLSYVKQQLIFRGRSTFTFNINSLFLLEPSHFIFWDEKTPICISDKHLSLSSFLASLHQAKTEMFHNWMRSYHLWFSIVLTVTKLGLWGGCQISTGLHTSPANGLHYALEPSFFWLRGHIWFLQVCSSSSFWQILGNYLVGLLCSFLECPSSLW